MSLTTRDRVDNKLRCIEAANTVEDHHADGARFFYVEAVLSVTNADGWELARFGNLNQDHVPLTRTEALKLIQIASTYATDHDLIITWSVIVLGQEMSA